MKGQHPHRSPRRWKQPDTGSNSLMNHTIIANKASRGQPIHNISYIGYT